MDFLKKGISKVKDTVSQVELVTKINEATANESGFANVALLNEISSRADNSEECKYIVKYCIKLLGSTTIIDVMKYKLYENPLIENDYFDVNHNVYKLAEDGKEEQINSSKNLENEKDEKKKKTIIYGNLLIERPFHKCNKNFSSRKEILGDNAGKRSSLMGSFLVSGIFLSFH